jgi:hypothetical protein
MERTNPGTWSSRCLIWFFTVLLTALFYWLLNFIIADIGSIPGPDIQAIETRYVDQTTIANWNKLQDDLEKTKRQIAEEKSRQTTLRDSTDNSQKTMNQLLEFQKLNLTQGTAPNDQERAAIVESEQLFLDNQREYQRLNQKVAQLEEEVRQRELEKETIQATLAEQRRPADAEYRRLWEKHNLLVAMWKLSVLLPLLLLAFLLYIKFRTGPYWALIYSFGIAVVIKVALVMHEYFPARYFKYIMIGTLLLVTLRILIYLLSSVAHPKKTWLLKQYREAYESFLCPICEHPIRRGPLKYMSWTKRSLRRIPIQSGAETPDESYTCPACTTQLYVPCAKCGAIRHALLPACTKCGAEIAIGNTDSKPS